MDDIKVISGPAKQGKREPLQGVKHKIMVMSGKGGVGKSTVAANIAVGLVQRGHAVGLLDADVHGPSIPRLLGATEERLMMSGDRIQPAEVLPRLKVMSIAYFLEEKDAPVVWRGPVKMGALRQFIEDVDWGELDYLIVDLPPGIDDGPGRCSMGMVAASVVPVGILQHPVLPALDRLLNGSAGSDVDIDAVAVQHIDGLRPKTPGKDDVDVLLLQLFGRRSDTAHMLASVLEHLDLARCKVIQRERCSPSEMLAYGLFHSAASLSRYTDYHLDPSGLYQA